MFKLIDKIDKVYVINLKKDTYRREHIKKQFNKRGIKYEIIDAVSYDDSIVKDFYRNNLVQFYPPCFRCKDGAGVNYHDNMECVHDNNFLTPKQVANFLSFQKIMSLVVDKKYKNVLVFEDDFYFKKFAKFSFRYLYKFLIKKNYFQLSEPFLFRIGSHTKVRKKYYLNLLLNKHTIIQNNYENMANPCFLFNYEFAKLFISEFKTIYTTSDNFIHKILPRSRKVFNFSIYPFPVGQHSYGNKINKFSSSIFTNNTGNDFENRIRVESQAEFNNLLNEWLISK